MEPTVKKKPIDATLYLGLHSGKNFGWGICSQNLIQELSALTKIHVIEKAGASDSEKQLPGPVFMGLVNEHFMPLFDNIRGIKNYGYTFFESELSDLSIENAKRFDLVLAGSTWCRDRMIEKGISNCGILIQGIDPKKFYPFSKRKKSDQFVIFSGGKFELRKGQDLVIRAVKILQEKYKDILLVNCWYNFWSQSINLMKSSPHIEVEQYVKQNWTQFMHKVYAKNGLDAGRIKTLEIVPNYMLREIYRQTDIGLFPNRCEGGTNLVLMEYMACGKPVIASYNSGHMDVVNENNAILLKEMKTLNLVDRQNRLFARWQEPSLDELVYRLEFAYLHRDLIQTIGDRAGEEMKDYTWAETARSLLKTIEG